MKANYRDKEVEVILEETENGVVVNIIGECSIMYNGNLLFNSLESGALKYISNNMIDWVKSNMAYLADDTGIDLQNNFTVYPLNYDNKVDEFVKIRHWMFNIDLMREYDEIGQIVSDIECELNELKSLFTDKIKLRYSHNSDIYDDFMDIVFKPEDFNKQLIENIMDKWNHINNKYIGYVYG